MIDYFTKEGKTMIDTVVLLYNPKAGDGAIKNIKTKLVDQLNETFKHVSSFDLTHHDDEAIVNEVKASDYCIIAGGDGTVNYLINLISPLESRPKLAILPLGTANDFARALNMPLKPLKAIEQIKAANFTNVDVGKCNDAFFLNFFGVGLISETKAQLETSNDKDTFGRFSYYLNSLKAVQNPSVFEVTLQLDGETIKDEAVMVMVANSGYTGGVQAFFNAPDYADGVFDVLVIKEASFKSFTELVQSKVSGNTETLEGVYKRTAKKITIETTPKQAIDCDGEDYGSTPATISVLPHHLSFCFVEKAQLFNTNADEG